MNPSSLQLLHVDNHLLAVVKPAGLPVAPDDSGDASLLELAREWVRVEFAKPGRAFLGLVHRLDRPVSGVVLFARTSKAAARLSAAFQAHRVTKTYLGVCARAPRPERGERELWLRKDAQRNRVEVVAPESPGARAARTRWRVLRKEGRRVLVELEPITGRSHQLRVTLAHLGAPLLGDLKYGAQEGLPDRSVALHARRLEVEHPTLKQPLRLEAPVPAMETWRFEGA